MTEHITINPRRIKYQMKLFGLSKEELLKKISEKLKNPIKEQEIFNDNIKESHLKKIDRIFDKGLSFYTDPNEPKEENKASIFFRKTNFNSTISLEDRKVVSKMETRIRSLSALSKLSNYKLSKKLDKSSLTDPPQEVAIQIRKKIYPIERNIPKDRDFLKTLINNFAEHNILVLEFIEYPNQKDRANIDGFFLTPNNIVIKRQQRSFKREIFTLIHELGHYLLTKEELDEQPFDIKTNHGSLNDVEKWCNDFAFTFLSADFEEELQDIFKQDPNYDNQQIKTYSQKYHISRLAIFTRLFTQETISWDKYSSFKRKLKDEYKAIEEKKQLEKIKETMGRQNKGRSPRPIYSPPEKEIYRNAYFKGVIGEYEVLSHFKEKYIDKFIYG